MLPVSPFQLVCWVDVLCMPQCVYLHVVVRLPLALPTLPSLPPSLPDHSFLCLSSKSPSPVVARMQSARDSGRLTPRDERTLIK